MIQLCIGGKGSDSYLLQRITLLTDVHLERTLAIFRRRNFRVIRKASHSRPSCAGQPHRTCNLVC